MSWNALDALRSSKGCIRVLRAVLDCHGQGTALLVDIQVVLGVAGFAFLELVVLNAVGNLRIRIDRAASIAVQEKSGGALTTVVARVIGKAVCSILLHTGLDCNGLNVVVDFVHTGADLVEVKTSWI